MSNKYLEKIAEDSISRAKLFDGMKHLNPDYYEGRRAGLGDSARAAGSSALIGAGLGAGATAAIGSVIPASHLLRGNNTLARLSLGRLGKHSLIGAGIGAAGLGATSLLKRYGSMKRTEAFDNKANALGISPEDRKHYVEEYNAFDDDLPASETAQRVHALMHSKQASDKEYRGPSYGAALGGSAVGTLAGLGLAYHGINAGDRAELDYLKSIGKEHLFDPKTKYRALPRDVAKIGSRRLNAGVFIGLVSPAVGLAAIPAIAAHRQYQDYKSGNKDPHYGRGALLGGMAGTLAVQNWHPAIGILGGAAAGLGAVGLNHLHNKWSNHE